MFFAPPPPPYTDVWYCCCVRHTDVLLGLALFCLVFGPGGCDPFGFQPCRLTGHNPTFELLWLHLGPS